MRLTGSNSFIELDIDNLNLSGAKPEITAGSQGRVSRSVQQSQPGSAKAATRGLGRASFAVRFMAASQSLIIAEQQNRNTATLHLKSLA